MTSKLLENGLMVGDSVVIPKSNLHMIAHYGVYVGRDNKSNHVFAENNISQGVRLVSAENFFKGCDSVLTTIKLNGNAIERNKAVQRGLSLIGKPYELLTFNCEHYSNYVQNEKPESSQIKKWFWTLILLAIVVISFHKYFKHTTSYNFL